MGRLGKIVREHAQFRHVASAVRCLGRLLLILLLFLPLLLLVPDLDDTGRHWHLHRWPLDDRVLYGSRAVLDGTAQLLVCRRTLTSLLVVVQVALARLNSGVLLPLHLTHDLDLTLETVRRLPIPLSLLRRKLVRHLYQVGYFLAVRLVVLDVSEAHWRPALIDGLAQTFLSLDGGRSRCLTLRIQLRSGHAAEVVLLGPVRGSIGRHEERRVIVRDVVERQMV